MSEIKNKIITISGEPVSGKSTVVKSLIKKYEEEGFNVHVISTGNLFREVIKEEYLKMYPDRIDANLADIQADESFAKKRAEIDGLIDGMIAEKGKEINSKERPNDVYIIDSRLAWHNIPDSYAVRLTVDEKIAGQRVFDDNTRGSEDAYKTVEEAVEKTRQRKLGEIERYKERYGVDLINPENYDLIVDTSYSNTAELANIIIDGEKAYREDNYYPKNWASPVHFLTVQKGRKTGERSASGYSIEDLADSIRQNGYDAVRGVIDIVENDGAKFVWEGNHRTFAALSAGKTLLPYEVIDKDSESSKLRTGSVYDDKTLEYIYDWADGIAYYGGSVGNIDSLKGFNVKQLISVDKIPIARKRFGLEKVSEEER